ncbi:pre-mRNA-splicing factor 18-like [Setaria italica]|uniref:pre-mRNA-splicing factor 18-like n=1 Tax=Setaria italica TaxID=4555 RepID=UPI000BE5E6B5|nr:pre-mRNA-splicing factor 18-like [Setaria italica]
MARGQTNDFLGDMIEMGKRQKFGRDAYAKSVGGGAGDGNGSRSGIDDADADKDSKRMKAKFDELCKEDKILVFFNALLNEWKQEVDGMAELEKRTANGKTKVARFNQSARYLGPLFEFCRKKILPDDIRQALLDIIECCMRHD